MAFSTAILRVTIALQLVLGLILLTVPSTDGFTSCVTKCVDRHRPTACLGPTILDIYNCMCFDSGDEVALVSEPPKTLFLPWLIIASKGLNACAANCKHEGKVDSDGAISCDTTLSSSAYQMSISHGKAGAPRAIGRSYSVAKDVLKRSTAKRGILHRFTPWSCTVPGMTCAVAEKSEASVPSEATAESETSASSPSAQTSLPITKRDPKFKSWSCTVPGMPCAVDAGALEAVGKHNVSGSSNISAYSAAQMSSSLSGLFSTTLPAVTPTPLPLEERDDIDAKVDAHVDAAHTIGTVVIESAGQSAPGLKWPPVPALSKSSYNDCTENGMPCAVDGGAVSNVEKAAQTMPPLAPAGLETYGLPTTLTTVAKPR